MKTTSQQVALTKSQELRKWKNSYVTSKKFKVIRMFTTETGHSVQCY